MARLSQQDQDAVLEALRDLYAETDLARLRPLMLRLVSRLVANDWASFNEIAREDHRSVINIRIPDSVEIQNRAPGLLACVGEHPRLKLAPIGSFAAYTMSDFLPWRDFARTTMFNDYYRYVGVRYQLFFTFDGGHGPFRGIAINRRHRDFSARDRSVLDLVSRHFGQAHANAARFERLQLVATAFEEPRGSALEMTLNLSADYRVEGLSEAGRRWIELHLGIAFHEGLPAPEPLRRWLRSEQDLRNQPGFLQEPRPLLRMFGSTGAITARFVVQDADGRMLLFLKSTAPETPVAKPCLPELTARENEVLSWIARGKSNPEIAIILGLSVRTVYKHVENLFAKIGVETRAQAMVRALEVR
jgi:DNA-binding CsgD family transcriptional regulator